MKQESPEDNAANIPLTEPMGEALAPESQEVADFIRELQNKGNSVPPVSAFEGNHDPTQVPVPLKGFTADDAESATPDYSKNQEDRIEVTPDPVIPPASGVSKLGTFNAMVHAHDKVPEISDEEREQYFNCFFEDTPFSLKISLMGGRSSVCVRDLTQYERKVVEAAIYKAMEGHKDDFLSGMFYTVTAQYYVATAVCEMNDQPFGLRFATPDVESYEIIEQDVVKLDEYVQKHISGMNSTKFSVLLRAAQEFDVKNKILANTALNEDFWKPRNTN